MNSTSNAVLKVEYFWKIKPCVFPNWRFVFRRTLSLCFLDKQKHRELFFQLVFYLMACQQAAFIFDLTAEEFVTSPSNCRHHWVVVAYHHWTSWMMTTTRCVLLIMRYHSRDHHDFFLCCREIDDSPYYPESSIVAGDVSRRCHATIGHTANLLSQGEIEQETPPNWWHNSPVSQLKISHNHSLSLHNIFLK